MKNNHKKLGTILRITFLFTIMVTGLTLTSSHSVQAREGWSLGATGMGNFSLTDSNPNVSIGPGGGIFFDYRFNQRWAIETNLFITDHNGRELSEGDDGMFLLGVPTAELKFYFRGQENNIDPYLSAGLGVFVLTEGDIENDSSGVGVGGMFGIGADFYVTNSISFGLATKFRPIALIQDNSNSTGLIIFSMIGSVAFHF